MGFAGARYDFGFVITYGFVWIVFQNVSLSFMIFLFEVYGSRERNRPPLRGDITLKIFLVLCPHP